MRPTFRSFLLISFLSTILWTSVALAASTCVDVGANAPVGMYYASSAGPVLTGEEVLLLCTAHTDGTVSVTLSGTTALDAIMIKLAGQYAWQLVSFPSTEGDSGGPAPTDNADLEITEQMTATIGLSLLGTNGTDFIDATTAKETVFLNSFLGLNTYRMATLARPWTIIASSVGSGGKFYLLFRKAP